MRPTRLVGPDRQPDGWTCGQRCPGVYRGPHAHEIHVQHQMVADLQDLDRFGPAFPCGKDPTTGEPLTLRQRFDRYAQALLVVAEVEARG